MATHRAVAGVDPLKDLLGDVLARLEALEAQVGKAPGAASVPKSPIPVKAALHGKSSVVSGRETDACSG